MAYKTAISTGNITDSIWAGSCATSAAVTSTLVTINNTTGVFTGTFAAPNTTGKTTGTWLFFRTKPTSGNIIITLQEATVDTVCTVTVPFTDIKLGWNYFRFPTPYQWTATTAGRYRFKVQSTVAGSAGGTLYCITTAQASFLDTNDTVGTLGTTDNMWIGGITTASGLSPITVTVVGTSTIHGDGEMKGSTGDNQLRTGGFGIGIGNGGTLVWDTTANATLQTRGAVVTYEGGTYDRTGNASDRTIVAKHIIDCDTLNGNYIINPSGGSVFKMVSRDLPTHYAEFVSGSGTTASPLIVDRTTNWKVGDRIIVEGNAYNQIEDKRIKTVINSTTFTTSDTVGGAEAGFTNAKTATATITNITRNSVIEPLDPTRSYFFTNWSNTTGVDVTGCLFNQPSLASGVGGITLKGVSAPFIDADYAVIAGGVSNRSGFILNGSKEYDTITGLVTYNATSSNINNSAFFSQNVANHTFNDCFQYGTVRENLGTNAVYSTVFNNYRSIGAGTDGNVASYAFKPINSGNITFNNSRFNSSRVRALYPSGTSSIVFNNCMFGNIATNVTDIEPVTDTSNGILFNNSSFASANLIANYLNQLPGSLIRFHKYQMTDDNHRWYTINGSGYSDDTEVATPGSLSARLQPETTTGLMFEYRIPVNVGETISVFGKVWGNATFVSDGAASITAELFLPGSLTPDQSITMTKTDDPDSNDAVYRLGLVNTSTVKDVSIVRITAKTTTPGAYTWVDDLNGGTNPISALDIWFEGQPLAFQLSPATLGDPAANAVAVQQLIQPQLNEILSNTDATQAKINEPEV